MLNHEMAAKESPSSRWRWADDSESLRGSTHAVTSSLPSQDDSCPQPPRYLVKGGFCEVHWVCSGGDGRARRAHWLGRRQRPVVRGRRIALAEHLVCAAFPRGIRWVRDVDLVKLVDLAGASTQVPDLYDAYNAVSPPVALPDFLGALSLLLGKGMLTNGATPA